MKTITDNQEKIDIVSRLVKDGAIDFAEAIKLLETEAYAPQIPYFPSIPGGGGLPIKPLYPTVKPWYEIDANKIVFRDTSTICHGMKSMADAPVALEN